MVESQLTQLTRDAHFHFTGSLPLYFVEKQAAERGVIDVLIAALQRLVPDFTTSEHVPESLEELIPHLVERGPALPYQWFYAAYSQIQNAIHPSTSEPREAREGFYERAFAAIIRSRQTEGVSGGSLFVSAGRSMDQLDLKLSAFERAMESTAMPDLHARITLPRTSTYLSSQFGAIDLMGRRILEGRLGYQYVKGIDISGDESAMPWTEVRQLAADSVALRQVMHERGREMTVSVHLGEDLCSIPIEDQLDRFSDMLQLRVDSIGHGVVLWIPEHCLEASSSRLAGYELERRRLLAEVIKSDIVFELCPTTSLLTQPLQSPDDLPTRTAYIPLQSVRIGTDSPAFFATTMARELALACPQVHADA